MGYYDIAKFDNIIVLSISLVDNNGLNDGILEEKLYTIL